MDRGRLVPCVVAALVLSACGQQAPSEAPSVTGSVPASVAPSEEPAEPSEEPTPSPQGPSAFAGAWTDATPPDMGSVGLWTNKVELVDLDVDGDVDILFANGGDYDAPGDPVSSQAWLNNGDGTFTDATTEVLGDHALLTRVIKAADLNGDSLPDILMGTTYNTQSRLLLSTGAGTWADVTATNLPAAELSIGDLEFGDVDADGDLDVVITDWGDTGPLVGGGRLQLWLNDGAGAFTDATEAQMAPTLIGFSWDIELLDIDNDWDLDLAVSCKLCDTSWLFENDGGGTFTDVTTGRLPSFGNNYEFAPIDLDGDGYLDLVTINDGPGLTEHVFRNDGTGTFVDVTRDWWPSEANVGFDDNVAIGIDIESDGDADVIIGSLDGPDRLLVNDGSGGLTLVTDAFDVPVSTGTLMMAVADLDGDGRPDVVEAQGEVAEDERIYLGTEVLSPDTAAPVVRAELVGTEVLARVHDHRTPNAPHDWQAVSVRWDGGTVALAWYGENLFRGRVPDGAANVEVCATDRAGNEACMAAAG